LVLPAIGLALAFCSPAASAADVAVAGPIPVTGILGVTFLSSDLGAIRQFYGHGTGFAVSSDSPRGIRFAVGKRQFLEFDAVPGYEGRRRLQYVTLGTPNLNDLERSLKARGVVATVVESLDAPRALEFRDPAGNVIHAVQGPEGDNPVAMESAPFSDHLQHMGFAVDLVSSNASIAFYRDTLGLPEVVRMDGTDGRLGLVKFRLPGPGRELIELIFHDSPLNKWAAGAFDHVNFEVSDINATYRTLHDSGIAPLPKHRPTVNGEHLWAINLADPELTRIEIQVLTPTVVPIDTVSTVDAASAQH
jgi:catechol 2,3-dioxygenase-like lactoylglutathione lyase family enzyme